MRHSSPHCNSVGFSSLPRFRHSESRHCPAISIVAPEIAHSTWFITWPLASLARSSFIFAFSCAFMSSSLWRFHTSVSCANFYCSGVLRCLLRDFFVAATSLHLHRLSSHSCVGGHALQRLFLLKSRHRVQDIPLLHKLLWSPSNESRFLSNFCSTCTAPSKLSASCVSSAVRAHSGGNCWDNTIAISDSLCCVQLQRQPMTQQMRLVPW